MTPDKTVAVAPEGRHTDPRSLVGLAEEAAVDLTLAVFQVDPVDGAVEVGHFAVFRSRDAQGAGEILDLLQHW